MRKEEYYCTNIKEKEYLEAHGFKYSFVKKIIDTTSTTVWKYIKTADLYKTLYKYYSNE